MAPSDIGLCADCQHVREVHNRRGSTFYHCGAAKDDPRLKKYPPLPVTACPAYSPVSGRPGA